MWDGQAWQPVPPMYASGSLAPGALVTDVGSGFSLPFRDPEWATKIIVQGLILLIPIVGTIAAYGWMLEYMDNLAQGRPVLPAAGFRMGRGFQLVVPGFVWGLVAFLPGITVYLVLILLSLGTSASTTTTAGGLSPTGTVLAALAAFFVWVLPLILALVFAFLHAPFVVSAWMRGMGGGFQVGHIVGQAFGRPGDTVIAALLVIVAGFVAGAGTLLCFVGVIFTTPLSLAFMAGFFVWYAGRVGELQAPV